MQNSRTKRTNDITERNDGVANALLCSFDEMVHTAAGRIEPASDGMILTLNGARRSRRIPTAKSAIYFLRKATKGGAA